MPAASSPVLLQLEQHEHACMCPYAIGVHLALEEGCVPTTEHARIAQDAQDAQDAQSTP